MKKSSVIAVLFISLILVMPLASAESNETEPETCAASISINFNKDVYSTGEYGELIIEVFDSQGNRIPNYVFYIVIYSEDYVELDSPTLVTTNSEGYIKEGGTLSREPMKILYKVYTEETSSCSGVEDTAEIEFIGEDTETVEQVGRVEPTPAEGGAGAILVQEVSPETCRDTDGGRDYYTRGFVTGEDEQGYYADNVGEVCLNVPSPHGDEVSASDYLAEGYCENNIIKLDIHTCPNGCKDGACIGGEVIINPDEEGKPINIPEEEILYACIGCELEGKCYPMGYRKEGQYCSDNNEFISQIKGACDNNFECKSNVCISGECIGEGLIKKIMNWLKKMFGGEPPKPPGPHMCPELLIEENFGEYEYKESAYSSNKGTRAPVYSKDGEKISEVTCCVVEYRVPLPQGQGMVGAIVCPYNNRKDLKNSMSWFVKDEGFVLEEYKDQEVCWGREEVIIWTRDNYLLAVSGEPPPENIIDAYLNKHPSDLGKINLPEVEAKESAPARGTITSSGFELADCEGIADSDRKNVCYSSVAVETKDISLCEKVTESQFWGKEMCYADFARGTEDISICERITDDNTREVCYIGVGQVTKDFSVCEKIVDSGTKHNCYHNIANQIEDVRVCEEVSEGIYRDACYYGVAQATMDGNLCDKITDTRRKENCYASMGSHLNDVRWCEKIVEFPRLKDTCYINFDPESKTPELCNKIIDSDKRERCHASIE